MQIPIKVAQFLKPINSYIFIGNGGPGTRGACHVHNPGYDFNDELIAPGAAFWLALVGDYLKK
jgi:hippurate hydrolase